MKEGQITIKNKLVTLSIIIMGLLLTIIVLVHGESTSGEITIINNDTVKLKNFEIPTNFQANSVIVEYVNLESGLKAIVTDKKSD